LDLLAGLANLGCSAFAVRSSLATLKFMDSKDLTGCASAELFDHALTNARVDPVLQSDDYWMCVRALHLRPDRAIFERAVSLCSDREPVARAVGADVLAQLGTREGYPFASESAPILIFLLRDTDSRVIASALYALGHLRRGESAELVTFADHPYQDVRCALAYTLGGRSDDLACGALVILSGDQDLDTRNWATFGLGTLCERDSTVIREALVTRLSDSDDEVRGEAMVGLARRQDVRTAGAILTELGRENVLNLAIEAAEEMPRSEFLPRLEELLAAHPDDEGIQRAVERCRSA
jgi:HEAT repeat protein